MHGLPIVSVDPDGGYPDVVGAPAVLSDGDDATGIRLSSAANGEGHIGDDAGYGDYGYAEYLIHFDGPLPATATSVTMTVRLQVLSRDMSDPGFEIRATLRDPDFAAAEVHVDRVCLDGDITDITAVLDDAWLAANAEALGDEYAWIESGTYTYAALAAALGPTPLIHLIDRDGSPFEVEILHVALTYADDETFHRVFPVDRRRNYPPNKATQRGRRNAGGYS